MPESMASALETASNAAPFRAGDFLQDDDAQRSLSSVKQLVRLGALRIIDDVMSVSLPYTGR